jgi:threonine/homoserine/homoserine lactone efflux protein
MIATTIALVVGTLLCLAFDATKWVGVAGVVLLFYLHPLLFTVLSVLGGVALYFARYNSRRKCNELPKLPAGRN